MCNRSSLVLFSFLFNSRFSAIRDILIRNFLSRGKITSKLSEGSIDDNSRMIVVKAPYWYLYSLVYFTISRNGKRRRTSSPDRNRITQESARAILKSYALRVQELEEYREGCNSMRYKMKRERERKKTDSEFKSTYRNRYRYKS